MLTETQIQPVCTTCWPVSDSVCLSMGNFLSGGQWLIHVAYTLTLTTCHENWRYPLAFQIQLSTAIALCYSDAPRQREENKPDPCQCLCVVSIHWHQKPSVRTLKYYRLLHYGNNQFQVVKCSIFCNKQKCLYKNTHNLFLKRSDLIIWNHYLTLE